ncbi:MAG: ClbS/DfsB family four-helix bundle protein [Pseudomonadota bacterium]
MPAATTRTDLINVTEKEYQKLQTLIEPIEAATALRKRSDDTSIKDIIAHRAHWVRLFLGWYKDGRAGQTVHFPAEGYKWNDLKAYNAMLRQSQTHLGWDEARAELRVSHAALRAFLDGHSNADLYGGPMRGANNAWTTGRWAEAAGPSHYRSAAKYIRACLREDRATAK